MSEQFQNHVIVAFNLEGDQFVKDLLSQFPDPITDPHITLLYLGLTTETEDVETLSKWLEDFASAHAPLSGVFSGAAVFNPSTDLGNKMPVVMLFDSPELPAFRQALKHSVPFEVVNQTHGFTPHLTLSYTEQNNSFIPDVRQTSSSYDLSRTFDSIWLYYGGEHYEFKLSGSIVEKSLEIFKQLPISESDKAKLLNLRVKLFNDTVDVLAEDLYSGKLSLGKWEADMKKNIRELHASAAAIAKGGWDEMTWKDWGRLGTPLREQYKYLHGFSQAILDKKDTISLKAIKARAHLYGNAAGGTGALIQAGADIEGQLPWMPKDGSTECLVNCKCRWVLSVVSTDPKSKKKIVEAVWELGVAEHCKDCVKRNGYTHVLTLSEDADVPRYIGGF